MGARFFGPKSRLKSNFETEKSILSRRVKKVDFKYRSFDFDLIRTHLMVLSAWNQHGTKVEKLFSTILVIKLLSRNLWVLNLGVYLNNLDVASSSSKTNSWRVVGSGENFDSYQNQNSHDETQD